MAEAPLTIGRLARAADVNLETVRYYQRLNLLPVPSTQGGAFRIYPPETAARIRFIKRAQDLGFSLREISGLLALQDGADRAAIRSIATERLSQIRVKLADLRRMERTLDHLIERCAATRGKHHCPIIAALVDVPAPAAALRASHPQPARRRAASH
ncbi:MAG TPA: MerR family DNA-binding protein [Gammaproteobacteria bacterium]|nr:MerR family DNA-binding protein [Gammaproteobacteria bacterium]